MFTIFWMIVASLATLYFTKPGFKRAVNRFFDWSDESNPGDGTTPAPAPLLTDVAPQGKGPAQDWMKWTDEDEERRNEHSD